MNIGAMLGKPALPPHLEDYAEGGRLQGRRRPVVQRQHRFCSPGHPRRPHSAQPLTQGVPLRPHQAALTSPTLNSVGVDCASPLRPRRGRILVGSSHNASLRVRCGGAADLGERLVVTADILPGQRFSGSIVAWKTRDNQGAQNNPRPGYMPRTVARMGGGGAHARRHPNLPRRFRHAI